MIRTMRILWIGLMLVVVVAQAQEAARPVAPDGPKPWPTIDLKSIGIQASLVTQWRDRELKYTLRVSPHDPTLASTFDKKARSNELNSFAIYFVDSHGSNLCRFQAANLVPIVNSKGETEALTANSSTTACLQDEYRKAASRTIQWGVEMATSDVARNWHGAGWVPSARLIHEVKPTCPPVAWQAGVQEMVRLEVVIASDGTIERLEKAVSGHPLLIKAAWDTVQHWRYAPTLIAGVPAPVVTTIDVHFARVCDIGKEVPSKAP